MELALASGKIKLEETQLLLEAYKYLLSFKPDETDAAE
jgi:hypothetical protein